MNITRFVANLYEARKSALIVITAKNNIAREHTFGLLDASIENMLEELNTIVSQSNMPYLTVAKIDKDALLKSLLEDAEEQRQSFEI
jgi:hypothetical protein